MVKAMNTWYAALLLNLDYLCFRMISVYFKWFSPEDFLWKMPVFPVLVVLPVLQFALVRRFLHRLRQGEVKQDSFFSAYKEAAKLGLLSAVLLSVTVWFYYSFINKTYLPTAVIFAVSEAVSSGMPADQLSAYSQTISTFNQPNLRAVFTLSGMTVFGMLSAWPAAFYASKHTKLR